MSYFNKQLLRILKEGISYDDIVHIYNTSEDILKQEKASGLTLTNPGNNSNSSYLLQQFRDAVGEQLKSGKSIDLKKLSMFFNETSDFHTKSIVKNDMEIEDIDKMKRVKQFLNNSKNILTDIKSYFKSVTNISSSGSKMWKNLQILATPGKHIIDKLTGRS